MGSVHRLHVLVCILIFLLKQGVVSCSGQARLKPIRPSSLASGTRTTVGIARCTRSQIAQDRFKNINHGTTLSFPRYVNRLCCCAESSDQSSSTQLNAKALLKTLGWMFVISAPLGMMLDNYHGLFGVLSYEPNGLPFTFSFGNAVATGAAATVAPNAIAKGSTVWLKSALWVPALFGVAGVAMSAILLYLDRILCTPLRTRLPTWALTWYAVAFFSLQYYLSGLLDYAEAPLPLLHGVLGAMTLTGLQLFDRSPAGLLLTLATALVGPAAEIFLVNTLHLYHYSSADLWSVCTWIPWVYALGAPAVGNLARSIYCMLASEEEVPSC